MDEDEREREGTTASPVREEAATPAPVKKRSRLRWPLLVLAGLIGVPALTLAMWTAIALNWSYSEGTRTGYIQKFSQKGYICKTWEGEIAMVNSPGAIQEKFLFSVRDDSIANEINKVMGTRVALTYKEHRGVPTSCFGETGYYVNGVKSLP
jgi:hypothetical protein